MPSVVRVHRFHPQHWFFGLFFFSCRPWCDEFLVAVRGASIGSILSTGFLDYFFSGAVRCATSFSGAVRGCEHMGSILSTGSYFRFVCRCRPWCDDSVLSSASKVVRRVMCACMRACARRMGAPGRRDAVQRARVLPARWDRSARSRQAPVGGQAPSPRPCPALHAPGRSPSECGRAV